MKIYVDGSGWNGRKSEYCVVAGEKIIRKQLAEKKTNNEMEYAALLEAFAIAKKGDIILTDSQLVHGQVCKGWKVNYEHLKPLVAKAKKLLAEKKLVLEWIPREENKAGQILEKH
ncbi:MAG: RNase H family protein [Candidatus Woesearchaeota archaeon]